MRLRTTIATLLLIVTSGSCALPAGAVSKSGSPSDAAVALPATSSQTVGLSERLQNTLPGASAQTAARLTAETVTQAKQAIARRTAANARASRARAIARIRMAIPAYGRISAGFASSGHWTTRHTGLDIDARSGDPVHSIRSGTVIKSTYNRYYGKIVVVRGYGVDIWYAHLSASYVKPGQHVKLGQKLGRVGCTGHCTGSHLHLEVRRHDLPTNPASFLWGSHRGKPGSSPAWARINIATLDSL